MYSLYILNTAYHVPMTVRYRSQCVIVYSASELVQEPDVWHCQKDMLGLVVIACFRKAYVPLLITANFSGGGRIGEFAQQ